MDNSATTPPPLYNDLNEKSADNNGPPKGFPTAPSSKDQYNYSAVPLNPPQMQQQPIQTQPQPQQLIITPGGPMIYGPHAIRLICPACQKNTVTRVEYQNSAMQHIAAAMLCFTGLCCCAPIPYFLDQCKNAVHHCTDCDSYLGTYSPANAGNRGNRGNRDHNY